MSLSLAFCIVASLYVTNECSYDRFHHDSSNIYRLEQVVNFRGIEKWETTPFILGERLRETLPATDASTRFISSMRKMKMETSQEDFRESFHLASENFLHFFDFKLLAGNQASIFKHPTDVIISERFSRRYFGNESPIGKNLRIYLQDTLASEFVVRGIIENPPSNSSIQFEVLISDYHFSTIFGEPNRTRWLTKAPVVHFVRKATEGTLEQMQYSLNLLSTAENLPSMYRLPDSVYAFTFAPFINTHLSDEINFQILAPTGHKNYIYALIGLCLFILLIAGINYTNLSIGLYATRNKEIGIRKVLGAAHSSLRWQLLGESNLMILLALILAIGFVTIFLPTFNQLLGVNLSLSTFWNPTFLLPLLIFALFIGFLVGSYPAILMASHKIAALLKGHIPLSQNRRAGNVLILIQFSTSIFLMICAGVFYAQINVLLETDLGYSPTSVIYQDIEQGVSDSFVKKYREALMQHPNIEEVSGMRANIFGNEIASFWMVEHDGQQQSLAAMKVDDHFADLLDISVLEGRFFDQEIDSTANIVVNEALIKAFNIQDPIGKQAPFGSNSPTIIGVIKDFHFQTLKHKVTPLILNLRLGSPNYQLLIKIARKNTPETIAKITQVWQNLSSDKPFSYHFLEDQLAKQYKNDNNWRLILSYASIFSLFISAFGLFAFLTLLMAQKRKEIGIRRILGASISTIFSEQLKPISWLWFIACGLAFPLAAWFIKQWLNEFTKTVSLHVQYFFIPALFFMFIISIIVGIQILKITRHGLSEAIREE